MRFIHKSVSFVLLICYMVMLVGGFFVSQAKPVEAATTYTYTKDSFSPQLYILKHQTANGGFTDTKYYYKNQTSGGISTWQGDSGTQGDVISVNLCKDTSVGTTSSGATIAISRASLVKNLVPSDCSSNGGGDTAKVVNVAVSVQYTNLEFSTGTGGRITVQPITIQLIIDGTSSVIAEGKTKQTVGASTNFSLGTVTLQNGFFVPGKYKLCVKELPKVACKSFTKTDAAASVQYILGLDYKDKDVRAISTNTAKDAGSTTDIEDSCYENTTGLGWVVCPLLSLLVGAVNKSKDIVTSLLTTKPLVFGSGTDTDPTYQTWQNFRNVADGLLIIVFLLIIFGTTASIGIDNYTIKKALPRLIAAAILIQFSYLICSLAIDLSNVIGGGIAALISGSTDVRAGFNGWDTAFIASAGLLALAGLIVSIGSLTILFVILGVFLSIIGALLTLVFRQILILVLVVMSPIAFVAWVLPNTESLFKLWNKNFVRVLAMFPLVGIIFGTSMLFAKVATSQSGTWQDLIGLIAIVLPLFAIPYTFKLGGQAMAFGSGLINGKLSGAGKSIRGSNWAKDTVKEQKQRRALGAQQNAEQDQKLRGWFNRTSALGVGSMLPGASASKERQLAKMAGSGLSDIEKSMEGVASTDTLLGLAKKGSVQERAAAIGELAKRRAYGELASLQSEALANPTGKTAMAYERAGNVYGGNFDPFPDLRMQGKRGGTGADTWRGSTAADMSDEAIAKSNNKSFENVVNDVTPSQASRILSNPNLSASLSVERRNALEQRKNNQHVVINPVGGMPGTTPHQPGTIAATSTGSSGVQAPSRQRAPATAQGSTPVGPTPPPGAAPRASSRQQAPGPIPTAPPERRAPVTDDMRQMIEDTEGNNIIPPSDQE